MAQAIQHQVRSTDVVARLGGDEFAILLMDTDQEHAQLVMTRVHQALDRKMQEEDRGVTFSIGVVTFRKPPATVDEVIKIADRTMYSVKNSTKSSISYLIFNGSQTP